MSDHINQSSSEGKPKRDGMIEENGNTDVPPKCKEELPIRINENNPSMTIDSRKRKYESSSPVRARTTRRTRRIPKKYTPNSTKNSGYCFCQKEDSGWYVVCSFQYIGCLIYYQSVSGLVIYILETMVQGTVIVTMASRICVLYAIKKRTPWADPCTSLRH